MMKNLFSLLLRAFYRHVEGADPYHVIATVLVPQKVLRINGRVPWPVSFRSRVIYPQRVEVGVRTFPGWSPGCYVQARNGIIIGSNLRMGPGVGLISANHDLDDYDKWSETPPIRIGDNVWLGMNSVVLPGVTIGDNVVVGANSVVSSDLPSNVVAAGSPCRIIHNKAPYQGRDYGRR